MDLCDKYTKLQVRTNADTPHDARVARQKRLLSRINRFF